MSFVADMFTGGGGGGGPTGYQSPHLKEYEGAGREGIYSRIGARKKKDGGYDFSETGKPIGVGKAKEGYDFGSYDAAMKKMGEYSPMDETYASGYTPGQYGATTFDYKTRPKEYADMAIEQGGKGIKRQGAGMLEKLRETVGTRRPGLLLKAGEGSQRQTGEQLADMQTQIRMKEMEKGTDLAVQQQKDQAEENYRKAGFDEDTARFKANEDFKAYGSRADLESRTADERFRRDTGSGEMAGKKIGLESTVAGGERDYADRGMEYLMDWFKSNAGITGDSQRAAAQDKTNRRGQSLDFLSKVNPFG